MTTRLPNHKSESQSERQRERLGEYQIWRARICDAANPPVGSIVPEFGARPFLMTTRLTNHKSDPYSERQKERLGEYQIWRARIWDAATR